MKALFDLVNGKESKHDSLRHSFLYFFAILALSLTFGATFTALSGGQSHAAMKLSNTNWVLVGGEGQTAMFDNKGRVSGNSGCNRYSGQYKIKSGSNPAKLSFDKILSTRMMCVSNNKMESERDFLTKMDKVSQAKVNGDRLDLLADGGRVLLSFKRK